MGRSLLRGTQIGDNSLTGADLHYKTGIYDETASYVPGDLVYWNGSRFRCIAVVSGTDSGDLTSAPDIALSNWMPYGVDGNVELVKFRSLTTSGEVPLTAASGEPVVNILDKRMWVGTGSGAPFEVGSTASGVTVHNDLTGRSAQDTHPISSITNLDTTLSGKSDVGHLHDDRYYTEAEVNQLFEDELLRFRHKELAEAHQLSRTRQFIPTINSTNPYARICSAEDNNVVYKNSVYLTTLDKGGYYLDTSVSAGDYYDSHKGICIGFLSNNSIDSAVPLAFADKKFFFYAFRMSSGGAGHIYVSCGPIDATVTLKEANGTIVDGPVDINANQTTILHTQGNTEYIIEATNDVSVYITSHNGDRDQRLCPPLSTTICGWPRNGRCSALYDNTVVNWYKRNGSSGTFTVSPGSPVNISSIIGNAPHYAPSDFTVMYASGPISAFSGADADGYNATAWFPTSVGLATKFPLPARVGNGQHISIGSLKEGRAYIYDSSNNLLHTFDLTGSFPYASRWVVSSNIGPGGYIESDVPCYICVDYSNDPDMSADAGNEAILLGSIPTELYDHLFDYSNPHHVQHSQLTDTSTNGHPISAITGLQDELDTIDYKESIVTGLIKGGIISQGTGSLDVDFTDGAGVVSDAQTNLMNQNTTDVNWSSGTITISPSSTTSLELYTIYVDSSGTVSYVASSSFNDRYSYIILGWVEVVNNAISDVYSAPKGITQTGYNLDDIHDIIPSSVKSEGLRVRPIEDTLSLYSDGGKLFVLGRDWASGGIKYSNIINLNSVGNSSTPLSFYPILHNNELVLGSQTTIPKFYDNSGTVFPIVSTQATIHYLFRNTDNFYLQLGSKTYTDFAAAFRDAVNNYYDTTFASSLGVDTKSVLVAQIIISAQAITFNDRTQALIINAVNGEIANVQSPVDLTRVPEYRLVARAGGFLYEGDELSMDIHGFMQKYPATGGERTSQYTNQTVIHHHAVFLDSTTNQGIIAWVVSGQSNIYFRTVQVNTNGAPSYSSTYSLSVASIPQEIRLCRIDSSRAGFIYVGDSNVYMGVVQNNGLSSQPSTGAIQSLMSSSNAPTSADIIWDSVRSNLIGVYSYDGANVNNRYCKISGVNVQAPPYSEISMCNGKVVRCVTENSNVIVTTVYDNRSYWVEALWNKPLFSTGRYDSLTNVRQLTNCSYHHGMQVISGDIFAQFISSGQINTYKTTYTSGSTMNTPSQYGMTMHGRAGDLIRSQSGVLYSLLLANNNLVEIYEGIPSGSYDLVYRSAFNADSSNTFLWAEFFGSIFTLGIGYYGSNARVLYTIDSSLTRTDHFIGVAVEDANPGDFMEVEVSLPIITMVEDGHPGSFFERGPYKYQMVTHNQAVIIIEAAAMLVG